MIIRPLVAADVNLVRDSFCKGVIAASPDVKGCSWQFLRSMIDRVIVDDYWRCVAYVDEAVEDEIISWCAVNVADRKVFWLATKPRYFKQGHGWTMLKQLMPQGPVYFPFHLNHPWIAVCAREGYRAEIRPFMSFETGR